MMRKAFMFLCAATLMVACSSEPDNNDANNGASNNGTNNGTTVTNNQTVDNSGAEYEAEYSFLFDSIAFNEDPANKLNMLLAANMDLNLDFPVLILLSLSDVDPEAGTIRIEGGSGLKTDTLGEYVFDPESEPMGTDGTLDATTGQMEANLGYFGFVATFVTEDGPIKTVLPINDLQLSGQINLADDGTASVVNGELAGYLTKEDGDDTTITIAAGGSPVSITSIFKEATLNYDTTTGMVVDRGTGDAWFLEGTFSAQETIIVQ